MKRRLSKIYPGWWLVLTSGMLALWGHGFHAYGFSAFFKPISSELGFTRAQTAIPASITRFEGGLEAPLAGWITDKYGPKYLVLTGVFLIGVSFIAMYFVNSLWGFIIVWGIIMGTAFNISLSIPMHTAVANWFVKKRGKAMGINWVMSGLSGVLVLPLVAWLISTQGWRMTCVVGGVVMMVVGLPLVWFFVRQQRPEYYGLLPDGATIEEEGAGTEQMIGRGVEYAAEMQEVEFTARQAMKTFPYWMLILTHSVHSLLAPAMSMHVIPFLTDMGMDPIKAAGMLALMVGSGIPARFIGGVVADRMKIGHLRFLKGGSYLVQAVGIAIFLQNQSMAMIYVFFILYGLGQGLSMPVTALMRARYFGRKAFGSIQGVSMMIMAPVGIAAPIYVGWLYDTTGSYMFAFTLMAILIAIAGFLAFLIIPPKKPDQIGGIRDIV